MNPSHLIPDVKEKEKMNEVVHSAYSSHRIKRIVALQQERKMFILEKQRVVAERNQIVKNIEEHVNEIDVELKELGLCLADETKFVSKKNDNSKFDLKIGGYATVRKRRGRPRKNNNLLTNGKFNIPTNKNVFENTPVDKDIVKDKENIESSDQKLMLECNIDSIINGRVRAQEKIIDTETSPNIISQQTVAGSLNQPKRKRGRPRKSSVNDEIHSNTISHQPQKRLKPRIMFIADEIHSITISHQPKKRGRPKKNFVDDEKNSNTISHHAKKRGRPKKFLVNDEKNAKTISHQPKKRGRPKKNFVDDENNSNTISHQPKKRSRPKKNFVDDKKNSNTISHQPKKRGRPKKKAKTISHHPKKRIRPKKNFVNDEKKANTISHQPKKRGRPTKKDPNTESVVSWYQKKIVSNVLQNVVNAIVSPEKKYNFTQLTKKGNKTFVKKKEGGRPYEQIKNRIIEHTSKEDIQKTMIGTGISETINTLVTSNQEDDETKAEKRIKELSIDKVIDRDRLTKIPIETHNDLPSQSISSNEKINTFSDKYDNHI